MTVIDDQPSLEQIQESAIELVLSNLREGTMQTEAEIAEVPVQLFTDPARAQAELKLFRGMPMVVAHGSEIAEPGSFITRDLLGQSLIIVRRDDGTVGAFLNMCRHRGGVVEEAESGSKRLFTCAYHGWSYNRDDGSLRHVPFDEDFGDFDRACRSLIDVTAEERHGMVWITIDAQEGQDVASYLGSEVDLHLGYHDLENHTLLMTKHIEVPVNWKIAMDGSADQLHVKFLHPTTVGKNAVTGRAAYLKFGRHGRNFNARKRMERLVSDGGDLGVARDSFTRYIGSILRLYPNVNCIQMPDHVEFWTIWPTADPALCTIDIRFFAPTATLTDEIRERVNRSWDVLNVAATEEDFPMEETIQRNAELNPGMTFVYGRNEIAIRHLHEVLEEDLGPIGTERIRPA